MTTEIDSDTAGNSDDQSGTVILGSTLSIQNIGELVDQLTAVVGANGPITITAEEVTSVDTAGLQVLVAFSNSMRAQSRVVHWQDKTGVLREFAELADLDGCLEIGSDQSSTEAVSAAQADDALCPVF